MKRYILEGEVRDKDSELVGRLRYFFKADNDVIAKTITQVIKDSFERGFFPYYGEGCVKNVKEYKLEKL